MKVTAKIIDLVKNIWENREMLLSLSRKDFVRKFSGTYFGALWSFIQPVLTILIYWMVFQFGFRSGDVGDIPFVVWFICGIAPWLYISEAVSIASNSFVEYSYLIKKVKFNINILPLVKIVSSFYIHLFFIAIITVISSLFGYYPKLYYLQLVYYMLSTMLFLFSLTLLTSSIVVFFRDLNQIINILLLIGMWGTPIAWSLSNFPDAKIQFVLKLNPFFYLIEGYRDSILARAWFWEKPLLSMYFWGVVLLHFVLGTIVYSRLKSHFADAL